jgi:tetratricopeptide (TPR) repeat protein
MRPLRRPRFARALLCGTAAFALLVAACDAPEVVPRDVAEPGAGTGPEPTDAASARILAQIEAMRENFRGRDTPVDILVTLGSLYYENGRYPDAIDFFRQAIEKAAPVLAMFHDLREAGYEPVRPMPESCIPDGREGAFAAAVARADLLLEAGDRTAAVSCYQAALTPIVEALGRRGGAWHMLESPPPAIEHIERGLAIQPDHPELLFLLGSVIFQADPRDLTTERVERGRRAWRRYVDVAPDHPRAGQIREALLQIEVMIAQGRFGVAGAGIAAASAIEMPPTAVGLPPALAEAERRLETGDLQGAMQLYDQFLEAVPNHPAAMVGRGRTLMRGGRLQDAEPVLRSALSAERNGRTLAAMAEWHATSGDATRAVEMFQQAIEADPAFAEAARLNERVAALR